MRVAANSCYVLRGTRYRESSLLLEVLSRDHGRLGLVARGAARRRARPWAGLLMPFRPLLLSWWGRRELGTLMQAEAVPAAAAAWEMLRGRCFLCSCYLNELLLRLLHRHDPHPRLFDAYAKALRGLTCSPSRDAEQESVLRGFELFLLQELGYRLLLDQEAEDGPLVRPEHDYLYQVGAGPRAAGPGGGGLRVSGNTLLALRHGRPLGLREQREARDLLRAHLHHYMNGRPLQSHGVYRDYQRLLARGSVDAAPAAGA